MLDEFGQDIAQSFGEVSSTKAVAIIRLRGPRGNGRKEDLLLFTSLFPCNSLLQVHGCRLLDSEPPVHEMFRFALDEP